ncbi:MAG: alpha/beta fold hydrolase [Cystobacter sp.]
MWIRPIVRHDAPDRHLLFFPWAGSGTEGIFHWKAHVPGQAAFSGVQLPGRGSRFKDAPVTSLQTLVDAVVAEIKALPRPPTVLQGHSLGALLAYEVCQRLQRDAVTRIERLVVSGLSAPHVLRHEQRIAHLPDETFLAHIKALDGIPEKVLALPQLVQLFLPILRADFTLFESYVFDPTHPALDCQLIVCGGREDASTSEQGLAAWRELAGGSFEMRLFDGGHFFIEPHAARVLELALA